MTTLRAVAQWIGLLLLITTALAAAAMVLSPVDLVREQPCIQRSVT